MKKYSKHRFFPKISGHSQLAMTDMTRTTNNSNFLFNFS